MPPIYLVVLTATIVPATEYVSRADPRVRLDDYKSGFRFWLHHPHPRLDKILFLENSGADLSELHAIFSRENRLGKTVEFISVGANRIPAGVHYGYGEMEMLDLGLQQSRLRRQTTHMIKATGRLTFPAIGRLLDRLPEEFKICVECRIPTSCYRWGINPLKILRSRREAYTSTQLMIFSHEFYNRELQRLYPTLAATEGRHYETVIYPPILRQEGMPGVFLRWPVDVEPVGIMGHSNKPYGTAKRRMVSRIRTLMRRVAPNFWI